MSAPARSWFVRDGLVLDPLDGIARRYDLIIRDGVIVESGEPGAGLTARATGLPVHDAADALIVPGLINAHTHGHANLMKGVADRWPLEVSLTHGPWLTGERDVETMYVSTLLGAIEMIRNGTTACYDLVYEFPRPTVAGLSAVARAYADAGMRAVVAPMIADRTLFEALPDLAASLPDAIAGETAGLALAPLEETAAVLRAFVAMRDTLPAGIDIALAPTIPHHCSDAFLLMCGDLAREHDLKLHMHLAESRLQRAAGTQHYGTSLTAHLNELGLLNDRFAAAHGVWLDENDLGLIASTRAAIVHVPASNFRLGSGLAPVRRMLEHGITVGLATDGANSSDALDMFLAMRLATFVSRARGGDRDTWLAASDAFHAATIGGAAVLGLGERIGRLAPGYAADLVFLDRSRPELTPLNNALNQLVNGNAGAAVSDVMIDGRFVVRNGLTPLWTADLRGRIDAICTRLRHDAEPVRRTAERLEPFVARFVADQPAETLR